MSDEKARLDSLFEAAIAIESPERRAAFIAQQCGDDKALQTQLELLLAADLEAGSFLEKPPAGIDVNAVPVDSSEQRAAALDAGLTWVFDPEQSVVLGSGNDSVLKALSRTIDIPRVSLREAEGDSDGPIEKPHSPYVALSSVTGRYRVDGEIARGGMGAILKGRDTDLGRDLAIKVLLDEYKDRPEVIQRFIEEAQIGGQLQHPGIAPVYELGQFADQRPFFSMKLVKGQTLSKLLSMRKTPAEDRGRFIGIFEQVCQTLSYAHARGVIHRDLKPSNIMVGAFGEVQVMDWGLAKVLPSGGVADEKKAQTKHQDVSVIETRRSAGSDAPGSNGSGGSETKMGSVLGTPAYMPPEQALGEIDQLDQRTDVFGLGAILCEILTGRPPYVGEDSTAIFRLASRGKIEDAFSRLDSSGADAELIALAKVCLDPDPENRSKNAFEVADRVSSYLESVESKLRTAEQERAAEAARVVEQKKRLKVTIGLAAAIILVFTGGILSTAWQARQATIARVAESERANSEQRAKDAAQKAQFQAEESAAKEKAANAIAQRRLEQIEKANEILGSIFSDLDPEEIAEQDEPLQVVLGKRLQQAVQQLEGDSIGDPLVVAKMQDTLGLSLRGLGLNSGATLILERALQSRRSELGAEHPDTLISMNNLALAYESAGRFEEAVTLHEKTLAIRRSELGTNDPVTRTSMNNLGSAYCWAGKYKEAIAVLEEALSLHSAELGPSHLDTLTSMNNLALAYLESGNYKAAVELLEKTLPLVTSELGPAHPNTVLCLNNLAMAYQSIDQPQRAVELLEEARQLYNNSLGIEHPETLKLCNNLANAYSASGNNEMAMSLHEDTLELCQKVLGREHPYTTTSMLNLGNSYAKNNDFDKAVSIYEETVELSESVYGPDHHHTLKVMVSLAAVYNVLGQLEKALPLQKEALGLLEAKLGPSHPDTLGGLFVLANIYRRAGQLELSLPLFERLVEPARTTLGSDHQETINYMVASANAHRDAGQLSKALPLYEEILKLREAKLGGDHPDTLKAMNNLGNCYWRNADLAKSIVLFEELLEREEALLGRKNVETLMTIGNLGVNYKDAGRLDEAIPLLEEAYKAVSEFTQLNWVGGYLLDAYAMTKNSEQTAHLSVELLADIRKALPPDSPELAGQLAKFGMLLDKAAAYVESESLLRECIAIRERQLPDSWLTFNTMSMLGAALLGQQKYADAEPLLLRGFEGMTARAEQNPPPARIQEAVERLIKFYDETGDEAAAAEWRESLKNHQSITKPE